MVRDFVTSYFSKEKFREQYKLRSKVRLSLENPSKGELAVNPPTAIHLGCRSKLSIAQKKAKRIYI